MLAVAAPAAYHGRMPAPFPMRRLASGLPCALLAMLVLAARLLAPSLVMAPASTVGLPTTICHVADPADAPSDHGSSPDRDHTCLTCPACQLLADAWPPVPAPVLVLAPRGTPIGHAAPPPPATPPPRQPRFAAQPTGPPDSSI